VSKKRNHCQNHNDLGCYGKSIAATCLPAIRQSSLRWHDSYTGFCMELGNLHLHACLFTNLPPVEWGIDQGKHSSTDGRCRDGLNRSSVEVSVMEREQRVLVIQSIFFNNSTRGRLRRRRQNQHKSFKASKREAYEWLRKLRDQNPRLFYHWEAGFKVM
jgi:hypothetical protein